MENIVSFISLSLFIISLCKILFFRITVDLVWENNIYYTISHGLIFYDRPTHRKTWH